MGVEHRDIPLIVGWETTLRCNMRCEHCGSTAGDARDNELDTETALRICRELVELGVERVVLTGGETLLRPDWKAMVTTLLDGGCDVGLLTNGWTLTDRMVGEIAEFRNRKFYLSISLDGTRPVHDRIRCLDGSWDRAVTGAARLKADGVPVAVITTMNRANLPSMPELRELLFSGLRPYAWQLQVTTPFGRARENDRMALSPVEYTQAAVFVSETRRLSRGTETYIHTGDCLGYLSSMEQDLRGWTWNGCGAGITLMGIMSNGDVIGCLSIRDERFLDGNVARDGVRAVWNKPGAFSYTRAFDEGKLGGMCAGCSVGARCRGGCTSNSISTAGRPNQSPYCLRKYEEAFASDVGDEPAAQPTRDDDACVLQRVL